MAVPLFPTSSAALAGMERYVAATRKGATALEHCILPATAVRPPTSTHGKQSRCATSAQEVEANAARDQPFSRPLHPAPRLPARHAVRHGSGARRDEIAPRLPQALALTDVEVGPPSTAMAPVQQPLDDCEGDATDSEPYGAGEDAEEDAAAAAAAAQPPHKRRRSGSGGAALAPLPALAAHVLAGAQRHPAGALHATAAPQPVAPAAPVAAPASTSPPLPTLR